MTALSSSSVLYLNYKYKLGKGSATFVPVAIPTIWQQIALYAVM